MIIDENHADYSKWQHRITYIIMQHFYESISEALADEIEEINELCEVFNKYYKEYGIRCFVDRSIDNGNRFAFEIVDDDLYFQWKMSEDM